MNDDYSDVSRVCKPGSVNWHPDFETACRQATASGKLVFLFQMLGRLDEEACCTNARLARLVLFSDDDVASFINANFESAWQSLRPVPMVRIDFRNGTVITRTLQSNIATSVCAPSGEVFDIIPGGYAPEVFLKRLIEFQSLSALLSLNSADRKAGLAQYHKDLIPQGTWGASDSVDAQRARLKIRLKSTDDFIKFSGSQPPAAMKPDTTNSAPGGWAAATRSMIAALFGGSTSSMRNEGAKSSPPPTPQSDIDHQSMLMMLDVERSSNQPAAENVATTKDLPSPRGPGNLSADETTQWEALLQDTLTNDTVRRTAIHRKLSSGVPFQPQSLVKWLYRDILRADLDDPYLGLGKLLFDNSIEK